MTMLILAAIFFFGIHFFVAGTRLRDVIVAGIGENAYLGAFSLTSLAGIVWLTLAYNAAFSGPGNTVLFDAGPGMRHLAIPVLAFAFLLGVPGLLQPNPAAARQENAASRGDVVRGVLRITRHPFLWGVAIWAWFHVAANGDLASVVFFATFGVLAILGTYSIDAKRKRKLGETWAPYARATSNIPFAAILAGRTGLSMGELFDWRMGAAALAFLAVLFAHGRLFSVSPFPTGWMPF